MPESVQQQQASIAVIDDDEAILDAIKLVLEEQDWKVRTYPNGDTFLADIGNYAAPDCLIIDPHLPGIAASEVVRQIATANTPIPIIGLTARPSSRLSQAVVASGARIMLTKPVTSETLVREVHKALHSLATGE